MNVSVSDKSGRHRLCEFVDEPPDMIAQDQLSLFNQDLHGLIDQ